MSNSFERFKDDTTVNYSRWAREQDKEYKKVAPIHLESVIDSFMLGPIAVRKGQTVEATTRIFEDIEKIVEELEEQDAKIVLYKIEIQQSEPTFSLHYEGENIVDCEYTGMGEPKWLIRGAWL